MFDIAWSIQAGTGIAEIIALEVSKQVGFLPWQLVSTHDCYRAWMDYQLVLPKELNFYLCI